jgi:hypothetical protein
MKSIRNLALPMLSAVALAATTGPAAQAQILAGPAGHATEARAATVIASAHYQAALTLTCSSDTCTGDFPAVPNRRRLTLSRVTCHLHSAQYAAYGSGRVNMRTASNVLSLVQFLPAEYSTEWGFHLINAAAAAQFAATQRVSVALSVVPGSGTAYDAACTAHGTLETLQ